MVWYALTIWREFKPQRSPTVPKNSKPRFGSEARLVGFNTAGLVWPRIVGPILTSRSYEFGLEGRADARTASDSENLVIAEPAERRGASIDFGGTPLSRQT